jgi:hypothetical protein
MIISTAIDEIIEQSPFLEEALSDGLINISSLARQLLPEVERLTKKKVQESAIIMAIHRRPSGQSFRISKGIKAFMNELGDIIVRSGLSDHTFENSASLNTCQRLLMELISGEKEAFCTISQGIYETTIVASSSLDEKIAEIFRSEKRLAQKGGLSSVTIRLPKNNTEVSGVYYFLLKNLAWAGINVCEIISTSNEVSIIVSEQDVPRAFPILMNLKSKRQNG